MPPPPPPIVLDPDLDTEALCDPPEGGDNNPFDPNNPIPAAPPGAGFVLDPVTSTQGGCTKPSGCPPNPPIPVPPPSALLSLGNRVYQFNHFMRVTEQGTLYLLYGNVGTSAVPLIIDQNGAMRGVSIGLSAPDPDNDYNLEILVNSGIGQPYSVAHTLPIPKTKQSEYRVDLTAEVWAGNGVGMRIVRSAGPGGRSTFRLVTVSLEMRDS